MDAVAAKVSIAEATYGELAANARHLDQTLHPDIASNFTRMKLAIASARRQAAAGDPDAAKESLDLAEVFATRVMKAGGR